MTRSDEVHHYVPQFYLRHWCDKHGKLWVHPVDGSAPFQSTPKSLAAEKGLYATGAFPELRHWDQEGDLSLIESGFARVWPNIFEDISDLRTKMNVARYLALTWLRHPNQKKQVRAINRTLIRNAKHAPAGEGEAVINAKDHDEVFHVSRVLEKATETDANTNEGFLRMMREAVPDIAEVLCSRRWAVVEAGNSVFATGDTPLVLWRGKCTRPHYGLGTPGTQLSFPICPTKLLMISDQLASDGFIHSLQSLGNINSGVTSVATRFVFTCDGTIH